MIICPNCNHQNPEGSVQCENCYTPLPSTYPCSNCGAFVQADATFCGQCGFNLQGRDNKTPQTTNNIGENDSQSYSLDEDLAPTAVNADSFKSPWDLEEEEEENLLEANEPSLSFNEVEITQPPASPFEEMEEEELLLEEEDLAENNDETEDLELWISSVKEESLTENTNETEEIPELFAIIDDLDSNNSFASIEEETSEPPTITPFEAEPEMIAENELETANLEVEEPETASAPVAETANLELEEPEIASAPVAETANLELEEPEIASAPVAETANLEVEEPEIAFAPEMTPQMPLVVDSSTRLQIQQAILFHTQTGNSLEIPPDLAVIRIGKSNNQVPPDIDVSGFPNSEIVSRVHADIRVEGDTYFIEDRGSSNGTYINNSPLLTGNRHRLRAGDRISLGKGDLVTFLFQMG